MLREDDEMLNLPPWAKALAVYGSPTIVTLYFTWWITGQVIQEVRATNDLLRPHVAASEEIHRTQRILVDLQRVQCVNAASNDVERRACIIAGSD